jgi:hypothetical protein
MPTLSAANFTLSPSFMPSSIFGSADAQELSTAIAEAGYTPVAAKAAKSGGCCGCCS